MHLLNYSHFDHVKNLNTPNWSPCQEENGADPWISRLNLWIQQNHTSWYLQPATYIGLILCSTTRGYCKIELLCGYSWPGLTITEGIEGQWTSVPPTNGLGTLEISLLFCYSLTCNSLGAPSCPFKIALKMGALQKPYFEACSWHYCARSYLACNSCRVPS